LGVANTGFVKGWEMVVVVAVIGIGVEGALQMRRTEVTEHIF
jgi:hypothetical protein